MKTILIENGTVISLGKENKVLNNYSLLIEGNKIKKIAASKDLANEQADEKIDAKNKVIMPGFINAHMHFYSSFARGLTKAPASDNFPEVLKNLWWRLDKKLNLDDVYYSSLVAMIEAIKKGTTTIIDHHASPFAITGSLSKIASAAEATGLRTSLCYEVSDRDGKKITHEGINENVNFIKRCNSEKNEMLSGLFGLHASFTLQQMTLEAVKEAMNGLDTGIHVHCAEDLTDQDITQKLSAYRVVERFHKLGLLGPKSICAHAVHIDERELKILKETDTIVVHNPQSNMNNACGVANTLDFAKEGIKFGLGTDAMTNNMLEEVRSALWIQKLRSQNPSAAFVETAEALTQNNPMIANRFFGEGKLGLGELKVGNAADVILMDYIPATDLDASNFYGHMIFGLSQSTVDTTIVNGKVLMKNKKLTLIDEEKIANEAKTFSQKLWDRF